MDVERAKTSIILKNSMYVYTTIDTEIFEEYSENDLNLFRKSMNIDDDSFMAVFGAISGSKNKLKVWIY